ncbi:MAG: phosphatase PAP2 family protein [Hyphomicrobiales bacterium]|nr:MAG: phosphatase PAP2 family protein [Hyphomicrobiales bacterium]
MIDSIRAVLDAVGQHPYLAILLAFAVSMTEAMPIIGLVTPSTTILAGLGGLIGFGQLEFWPIFAATAAGAITGDALSYWIGRIYRDRLTSVWPFTRHRALFEAGTAYFQRNGGKSIFIGRFIPGIKSVVPCVAGMMGMSAARFTAINVVSAVAWAAAHILPGYFAGALLLFTGAISKRLAVSLAALAVLTLLILWLVRFAVRIGLRYLPRLQSALTRWAAHRRGALGPAILRLVSPDHADFRLLVILLVLFAGAIISFAAILDNVVTGDSVRLLDTAVSQFLQSLRTRWGDGTMIGATMIGDTPVTLGAAIVAAAVLALRGRRRLVIGMAIVMISAAGFVTEMKRFVHSARPSEMFAGVDAFSFPSGHATMAATLYGILGLIALRGLPARAGRIVAVLLAVLVALIAFSRVYLAAHWPSDVAAGLLFGAAATSGLALVFRRYEVPRRTAGMTLGAVAVALVLIGSWHISRGFSQLETVYARPEPPVIALLADWRLGGWRDLPDRRVDLVGETEEPLLLQWHGGATSLVQALEPLGWTVAPRWSVQALNGYVVPGSTAARLPATPSLHNGRRETVTTILPVGADSRDGRYILRAWPLETSALNDDTETIFVASITYERIHHPLGLLSLPLRAGDGTCDGTALLARLPSATVVGEDRAGSCGGRLVLAEPQD